MKSEAVRVVERIYDGWSHGDYSWDEWADPDIDFEIADGLDAGRWRGRVAMADAWRLYLGAWRNLRGQPERIVESGDAVLVITRFSGSGRLSGVPVVSGTRAALFEFHDGRATRLVLWNDAERALREFHS